MDWTKAKNILIIAFIFMNLLLAYILFSNEGYSDSFLYDDSDFIREVKNKLYEKGIKINCTIPNEYPEMGLLTIKYEMYNSFKLADRFFDEYESEYIEHGIIFNSNEEKLKVINNNKVIYENFSEENNYKDLDDNKANNIAEDFLKNKGFADKDFKLTNYTVDCNKYILEYTKLYENILVEASVMKFEIDSAGVTKFERKWIITEGISQAKIITRTPHQALLRLLSRKEIYNKEIEDVSLSYYYNPEEHSIGDIKDPKQWQAGPAWRIKFSDGTKIFLEEY